jgi:hypothetical protein
MTDHFSVDRQTLRFRQSQVSAIENVFLYIRRQQELERWESHVLIHEVTSDPNDPKHQVTGNDPLV